MAKIDTINVGGVPYDVAAKHVDAELSATSENPVQNKAVKNALDQLDAYASGSITHNGSGTIGWNKFGRIVSLTTFNLNVVPDGTTDAGHKIIAKLPSNLATGTWYWPWANLLIENGSLLLSNAASSNNVGYVSVMYISSAL